MNATTKAALRRAVKRARGETEPDAALEPTARVARRAREQLDSDACDTFCQALVAARAMVELDATLTGAARRRHRGRLLVRANRGELPAALAFATWALSAAAP